MCEVRLSDDDVNVKCKKKVGLFFFSSSSSTKYRQQVVV